MGRVRGVGEPAREAGSDDRSWAAIPVGMESPGAFDRFDRQVLRYDSAPLDADVHVAGPVELALPCAAPL